MADVKIDGRRMSRVWVGIDVRVERRDLKVV